VTRRRRALLRGRGWISQLVECGGQPTDIVDISRRKARGLVFGEPATETIGVTPSCIGRTCTPLGEARRWYTTEPLAAANIGTTSE
jgi:hypothetical protein